MKLGYFLLLVVSLSLTDICSAQDLNRRILMNVAGRDVEAGEFIRMYNKSREPDKPLDVNEYLKQFELFKLKVADAINEGIDTTSAFRNELAGYREQLARGYLTDSQARERLLEKAYERSLSEVNAWHILFALQGMPSPSDTLAAWNKAVEARKRILSGEAFEEVARSASEDPSVKINGGNLGYFTVFQMITPFEDAAYTLPQGEISMPVRTRFGYHIIKVTGKRPSRGKVHVAHIMKAVPPGSADSAYTAAEKSINEIYARLNAGAAFSKMAMEFSDHKESAARGGELSWFGTGEIIPEFSEASFAISDTGKFTKPVRTPFGWHIIKLLGKQGIPSYEESKPYIESRISIDLLASLSKQSFISGLKNEYKFRIDTKAFDWFVKNTDTAIMRGHKKYSRSAVPTGNIYTFADQYLTNRDFADFIEKNVAIAETNDPQQFTGQILEVRVADHITEYENSGLENKYPEFRYLMNEFHDGILLFEISDRKVWNMVSSDTTGLASYYEAKRKTMNPVPTSLEEVRGEMMKEYQEHLENEWAEQLKKRYNVRIYEAIKEEVIRRINDD